MSPFLDSWVKTKSSSHLREYITSLPPPAKGDLYHPWTPLINDTIWAGLLSTITTEDVTTLLSQLAHLNGDDSKAIVSRIFIDLIWVIEIGNDTAGDNQQERLKELTKAIIAENFIPVHLMKERWEITFLESVGLIADAKIFMKRVIRINTSQLYKQQKFNLMQEESEGYSKLLTRLTSETADDLHNPASTVKVVDSIMDSIVSLIGYFDLDPTRVLDLVLDSFTSNIMTHCQFFIELLRKWTSRSNELELVGNSACAHILGFKLESLQRPENRHKDASTLYMTTALLLKENIIDMEDIYPHLSLTDEDLEVEYKKWVSDMKEKAGSLKTNALTMAGALPDDDAPAAAGGSKDVIMADVAVEVVPELSIPNQKVGLLSAQLSIGDIENAMFTLVRFPKITATHPEVADLICRIVRVMIQNVYDSISPKALHPALKKDSDFPYKYPPRKDSESDIVVERTLSPNVPLSTETTRYEFFYTQWDKHLVRCSTLKDIATLVHPMLVVIGVRIYRDPKLITMLCRIGAAELSRLGALITELSVAVKAKKDHDDTETKEKLSAVKMEHSKVESTWIDMARRLFLPAISLTHSNPGLVTEIWKVFKCMRYETRFSMYGEWKTESGKLHPELMVAYANTEKEAKNIMRRINKVDVKHYGRMFAKLTHSNPLIVFAAAMRQLEGGYDNLVLPLVDACRYLSAFDYDVLGYALLESLSKTSKSKVQDDGTTPARWIQTLASFCGNLYRKYPHAEFDALLQYIINKLRLKNAEDLVLLKELLTKMGGIEDTSNLNAAQVLGMAGGESLRNEAIFGGITGAVVKKNAKSSLRLQEVMIHDNIGTHLLVALGQHCQDCIFQTPEIPHIRVLSVISDLTHAVCLQLIDFLGSNLQREYGRLCPSLTDLCDSYKIQPSAAMIILRPKLQALARQEQRQLALATALATKAKEEAAAAAAAENTGAISKEVTVASPVPEAEEKVWMSSLESVTQEISAILPPRVWRGMTPNFYVTFWQLSLYDIFVPEDQYRAEINKQKAFAMALDNDRNNHSAREQAKRHKERERYFQAATRLEFEMESQLQNKKKIMVRLNREKGHWFQGLTADRPESISQVIQCCIFPRAKNSPIDALFCAKFISLLHSIGTLNFSTLTLYDKLFMEVDRIIFLSTEYEAKTYGGFLRELLAHLSKWHKNRSLYEKEGRSSDLPGFQKKWGPKSSVGKINEEDLLDYEDFRHALYKWHIKLFKACDTALASKDHMRIRNAIMILREVSSCYPAMNPVGEKLSQRVKEIATTETRNDLKLLANAYLAVLKKSEDSRSWVTVSEFHIAKEAIKSEAPKVESSASATNQTDNRPSATSTNRSDHRSESRSDTRADSKPDNRSDSRPDSRSDRHDGTSDRDRNGRSSGLASSSQPSRDRASGSSRDTRTFESSSNNLGRRVVPLPPKPGTPSHDNRDSRDIRDSRDGRDSRDAREPREGRDLRDGRDGRERDTREQRDGRDGRDARDNREQRDSRDGREVRESREASVKETPKADAPQELLVISFHDHKDTPKDNKDNTVAATTTATTTTPILDATMTEAVTNATSTPYSRDQSREQGRNSPREANRDTNRDSGRDSSRDRPKDEPTRDRAREADLSRERSKDAVDLGDLPRAREEARKAVLASVEHRDRRDARESREPRDSREPRESRESRDATARKELRDSAPRDPREVATELVRTSSREGREGRDRNGAGNGSSARDGRETRDSRDSRDSRESRENRDARDSRESREARDGRDTRESRDGRDGDGREARDNRDIRDGREARSRDSRDRDTREGDTRDHRESRGSRDPREGRSTRESRSTRDNRENRESRDSRTMAAPRDPRDLRDEIRDSRDGRSDSPRGSREDDVQKQIERGLKRRGRDKDVGGADRESKRRRSREKDLTLEPERAPRDRGSDRDDKSREKTSEASPRHRPALDRLRSDNPSSGSSGRDQDRPRSENITREQDRSRSENPAREQDRSRSENPPRDQDRPRSENVTREQDRSRSENITREQDRSRSENITREQDRSRSENITKEQDRSRSENPPREQDRSRSENPPREQDRSRSENPPREQDRSRSENPSREQDRSRSEIPPREQDRSRSENTARDQDRSRSENSTKEQDRPESSSERRRPSEREEAIQAGSRSDSRETQSSPKRRMDPDQAPETGPKKKFRINRN